MYLEIDMYEGTAEVRESIDKVMEEFDAVGFVDHLPKEITLVEPAYDNCDCEDYALGTRGGFMRLLPFLFPEIVDPKTGDRVLYCNGCPEHMGTLQEDETVTSKWGEGGPVLNHPLDYVPNAYGETVIFRRISQEDVQRLMNGELSFSLEFFLESNYHKI